MQLTVGQQEEFLRMIPKEWDKATPKETRKIIVDEFMPVYRKVVRFTPTQRTELFKLVEPELKKAMKDPETLAFINAMGVEVVASTPEQFKTWLAENTATWAKLATELGIDKQK